MANCKECIHYKVCCQKTLHVVTGMDFVYRYKYNHIERVCKDFKDRSRFVELQTAHWIRHSPDKNIMREFHKQGIGRGMGENSIFGLALIVRVGAISALNTALLAALKLKKPNRR